ncbi:MAG TPA: response regulator [Elusimicrobiota bacterium]|nr:response regulator [Elusimicrobiota bacterium]
MAKVLVADDSAVLLKVARLVFEKAGHRVESASDGQMALDRARTFRPDLIVLDAEMPVLSGLEACRALKADPLTAAAPVHIYTGHDVDGPAAAAFREAGAAAVHAKPYTPAALLALLAG